MKAIPQIPTMAQIVSNEKPTQALVRYLQDVNDVLKEIQENMIEEAPEDGNSYARKDGAWVIIP